MHIYLVRLLFVATARIFLHKVIRAQALLVDLASGICLGIGATLILTC